MRQSSTPWLRSRRFLCGRCLPWRLGRSLCALHPNRRSSPLGADALQQHTRRFVVRILRYQFSAEGLGEDSLVEVIDKLARLSLQRRMRRIWPRENAASRVRPMWIKVQDGLQKL